MKNIAAFFLVAGLMMTGNCTARLPEKNIPAAGTYQIKLDIRVLGASRSYFLHVPENHRPGQKTPLVLVLHGAFSTPRQVERESGFSGLADREDILVAYPTGAYGLFGFFRHWNAGHCCGKAAADDTDDVGFLKSVIEDIGGRFNVDEERVYLAGFSNGGMLAYRFAAEQTRRLAAVAPLAAVIGGRAFPAAPLWMTPEPRGTLPLIVFHATDDPNVPYEGGASRRGGEKREYLSVVESVDFWVKNNRCRLEPDVDVLRGGRVVKKTWPDPLGKNDVVLYAVENWGHVWPGRFFTDRLSASDSLRGFDAAEIIWDFFKNRRRNVPDGR